jgi:PAS domain S-box-containing protein
MNPSGKRTRTARANAASSGGLYFGSLAALLVFLPIFVFFMMRNLVDRQREARFLIEAAQMRSVINQNIDNLSDSLNAVKGFFASSENVNRREWMTFTQYLEASREYHGIMKMRYYEKVEKDRLGAFVDSVRADTSVKPEGYPQFAVFPEGDRDVYFPVMYVNPESEGFEAMGFDVASEPLRRHALTEAAEENRIVITGPLRWLAKPSEKWVMLFILPIFENGREIPPAGGRLDRVAGFVDIAVDVQAYFDGMLREATLKRPPVFCRIWTKAQRVAGKRGSVPIFDNRPAGLRSETALYFYARSAVDFGGREWQLEFFADSRFGTSPLQTLIPYASCLGGLLVSALFFWIILLAHSAQDKAHAMARRMTRDLEASRQRLLMAQSAAHFGAWDWDLKTNQVYWTDEQCRLYGLPPAAQGQYAEWEARVHPDDLPSVLAAVQKSLASGSDYGAEFRIIPEPGMSRWIAARGKIYRDASGKPVRMVGIDMDITDRKKFESQLLQSQKMETVGTLAGGIAHDLNNQLSPLLGYVDLILQQTAPRKSQPRHAGRSSHGRRALRGHRQAPAAFFAAFHAEKRAGRTE